MKTQRLFDFVISVLVALFFLIPAAHAETLKEIFESVLEQAITTPLPSVVEPLVTAAEAADTNEITDLEITVVNRQRRIELVYVSTPQRQQVRFERQMKACAQIQSELIRIKNQRTGGASRVRAAKEGGRWNLFHGRFNVDPAPDDWYEGTYDTMLLRDGFGDIRGDDPPGPISAVVTLASTGYEAYSVPARGGQLTVWGDEYDECWECSLGIYNLYYWMGSFEVADGVWTGNNTGILNPYGSRPVGNYNFGSEQFALRLEGMFTNDLYDVSLPILFFANISGGAPGYYSGVYDESEAMVAADVPMIVPLIGDAAELKLPKVMGAHILEFDGRGRLIMLENTTMRSDADIAMVRYNDGNYAYSPRDDEAIGARVVIDPLIYMGESPPGVFNFSYAAIEIVKDRNTILTGLLYNPTLDVSTGGFFAELEITMASSSSAALMQIGRAGGKKMMQLAFGASAYDLVRLTEGFSVPGRMLWPEVFHLGAFNRVPVADAGSDKTVYSSFDGMAEVVLDGSDSNDPDGDELTYLWRWTIEGDDFTARGVMPAIELPVGEHVIELTVNDGIDDSEPDHVVITVIKSIESQLWVVPKVVNRSSGRTTILALVYLASGVTQDPIDSEEPLLLYPGGIEATNHRIAGKSDSVKILALFDKTKLMDAVLYNGRVKLHVVGQLESGRHFHGTDTIRIINSRNGSHGGRQQRFFKGNPGLREKVSTEDRNLLRR